jgi:hypothetical protein
METSGASRKRGMLSTLLFPAIKTRFAVALLFTFFPYGLLYPLDYPVGELLTLCCWIWVFPSPIGWMSLGLMPLIATTAYGYFAFNLFCLVANLSFAFSASQCEKLRIGDLDGLYEFAKGCMIATLVIAAMQAITGPYIWAPMFPHMLLDFGRGAGLKAEPSQLASLLALYLVLLAGRMEGLRATRAPLRKSLFKEGIWTIVATVAVTRSISVLIIVICFVAVLFIQKRHAFLTMVALPAAVVVTVSVLGDRIREAMVTAGGSMIDLITISVGSWRNIPDIVILSNSQAFLFPGNPAEIRIKIKTFAALLSPAFVWLENTYSIFAAGGVTVGLLVTAVVFIAGLVAGMRSFSTSPSMRTTWFMMYLASWFILSKYDPSGWVVLGLLPLMHKLNENNRNETPRPDREVANLGDGDMKSSPKPPGAAWPLQASPSNPRMPARASE